MRHVDDARRPGAVLRCYDVRVGAGLGYAPTVLDRGNAEAKVVREQSFGAVIAICQVTDAEGAVECANTNAQCLGG